MKERRDRSKFSKEFKAEAVSMSAKRSLSEVAESLDIDVSLLSRWRREAEEDGADAFRGKGNRSALEEENRQLRKELADVKEEKEILKKAAAYFAKYHK